MARTLTLRYNSNINLTFVQSRHALHKPGLYRLFVDVQGHVDDPGVAAALSEFRAERIHFETLGSYPDTLSPFDQPID